MNAVHLHLALSHFPIIGILIGVIVLIYGVIKGSKEVKKIALYTFFIMAIFTIPIFLTGEETEEAVEHLPGVFESNIEAHEEFAEKAIWFIGLLGLLSAFTLYSMKKALPSQKKLIQATLVVSIITFGVFAQLSYLGGQIRHSEIRPSTTQTDAAGHDHDEHHDHDGDHDDD